MRCCSSPTSITSSSVVVVVVVCGVLRLEREVVVEMVVCSVSTANCYAVDPGTVTLVGSWFSVYGVVKV